MGHTYIQMWAHIVFGTKYRLPFIDEELAPRLFAYVGGIIRELGGIALLVNGPTDHVHILTSLPPRVPLCDFMRVVKTNSSRWVHEQYPTRRHFAWQTGYGAFSVSQSAVETVKAYIANQQEHHRRRTFPDEYLGLLREYAVEYDEKYIWD